MPEEPAKDLFSDSNYLAILQRVAISLLKSFISSILNWNFLGKRERIVLAKVDIFYEKFYFTIFVFYVFSFTL